MNEALSIYLDFKPEDKEKVNILLEDMDREILHVGWKYMGFRNMYVPVNSRDRDETILDVREKLENLPWLKPYHPRVCPCNSINQVTPDRIDVSGMSDPSPLKFRRYEEYFQSEHKMAHDIVVDENGKIRDGYISLLLAQKYSVNTDIQTVWSFKPLCKVVYAVHVRWDGSGYKDNTQKRYCWRYGLKEAVVPGDILLVNTGKGRKHVRVIDVGYVTGEKICRKYRKAVKNETAKL